MTGLSQTLGRYCKLILTLSPAEATPVLVFKVLVAAHVLTGTVGLLTLWVPIFARKGSAAHRRWGHWFCHALLATGIIAAGISTCTLLYPLETHPFWDDAARVRAVFGWMMLYLAVLTIALTRYGILCIRNREQHTANRHPLNQALQVLMFLCAANCMAQGLLVGEYLLCGIAIVGLAAGVLNLHFIYRRTPPPGEWLIQHSRGVVGAGISVYTAFLAFGAVNFLPSFAFSPVVWATPCTLGISYLLYHQYQIRARFRGRPTTTAHARTPALSGGGGANA